MRKLLLFLLVVGLAGGGYWYWRQQNKETAGPRVLASEKLARGSVREVIEATGIIKLQVGAEVKLGAQATGFIQKMLVRVGQTVRRDEVVALIDGRVLEAQKMRLEADLRKWRASTEYAKKILARQNALRSKNTVDQDTVDRAVEKALVAQSECEALEGQLKEIEAKLSFTKITSPISGVVSQVTAQGGETVVTGFQVVNLVTVIDPTALEMWIYMDETDVGRIRPGQLVEFRVDAFPGETFRSTVKQIYPKPEIRDNIVYYQTLAPIPKEMADKLRPEMTTHCRVVSEEKSGILALPNTALKWVNGEQVVYVKRVGANGPPVYEASRPELGLSGLTHSEVLRGLQEGDEVATQLILAQSAPSSSAPPPAQAPAQNRKNPLKR